MLPQPWAERAIGKITTSKYTFIAFVTALREQLQIQIEKKQQVVESSPDTFYQKYDSNPQRMTSQPHAPKQ